ncbi:hypothetical protein QR685DRAFT_587447 [Neurospora intermedia]|uniref:Uncharacterized protein n=1 Tax=Neurospora intermedia TaxID=5142 RepID=A0ABR3DCX6_NEUIN
MTVVPVSLVPTEYYGTPLACLLPGTFPVVNHICPRCQPQTTHYHTVGDDVQPSTHMPTSLAPSLQESHGLNKPMPPGESPPTIMATVRPLVRQLGPSPAIWPDGPVTALPIHVWRGVGQVPILPSYHDSPRILALASSNHNSTLSRVMIKSEDCQVRSPGTAALGSLLGDNRHQTDSLAGKSRLKCWDLLFFRSFVLLFLPPSSLHHVVVHFIKQYNDNDNSDYNDKSRNILFPRLLLAEACPITMSQLFCSSGAIALLFPVGYSPTTTSASALHWNSLSNKFGRLVNQTCISFPFRAPNVQHDKEQLPAHVPLQLVKLFEIIHRAIVWPRKTIFRKSSVSVRYIWPLQPLPSPNFLQQPVIFPHSGGVLSLNSPSSLTRQRFVVSIPSAKIRIIAAE